VQQATRSLDLGGGDEANAPLIYADISAKCSDDGQITISEKGIAKENMVGVARIELATPAMSTQCSTTELYAHAASASSGAWCIIQAYFSSPKLSLA
jgi:hypothetical protein